MIRWFVDLSKVLSFFLPVGVVLELFFFPADFVLLVDFVVLALFVAFVASAVGLAPLAVTLAPLAAGLASLIVGLVVFSVLTALGDLMKLVILVSLPLLAGLVLFATDADLPLCSLGEALAFRLVGLFSFGGLMLFRAGCLFSFDFALADLFSFDDDLVAAALAVVLVGFFALTVLRGYLERTFGSLRNNVRWRVRGFR